MSDCCFLVLHEIRARSEGRAKRPREQAGTVAGTGSVGMEIGNNAGNTNMMRNGSGDGDKMEVESSSNHATDGDRSSEESHKESSYNNRSSPKQVTDDSCESEDTEKGKPSNEGCFSERNDSVRYRQHEHQHQQQHQQQHRQGVKTKGQSQVHENGNGNERNARERESGMKRAGPVMEGDQQSSVSDIRSPTLPQHERIQHVEPLDINYRSTPACLKLREMLVSRLHLIAPTGRIQVVSSFIESVFAKQTVSVRVL